MFLNFLESAVIALQLTHQREHTIPLISPLCGLIAGAVGLVAVAADAPGWVAILVPLIVSVTTVIVAKINQKGNSGQWRQRYHDVLERETHKDYARKLVDEEHAATVKRLQDELADLRSTAASRFKEPKD